MAVDPNDPWGDPFTVPQPGAYDYRVSNTAYDYTPEQVENVELTASANPWMSPGIASVAAYNDLSPEVTDAAFADAQMNTPALSKRRRSEMRRNLRDARARLADSVKFLRDYGAGRYTPDTPGWQMWFETVGVFGGKDEAQDRGKAITVANTLESIANNADHRTVLQYGKQFEKLNDAARRRDGGDEGLGAFVMSPLLGALTTADFAIQGGNTLASDRFLPNYAERINDPLKPIVKNTLIGAQAPLDVVTAATRQAAAKIDEDPTNASNFGGVGGFVQNALDAAKDPAAQELDPTKWLSAYVDRSKNEWQDVLEQTYAYQAWVNGKATGEGWLPSYDKKVETTKIVDGKEMTVKEESAAAAAGRRARELYPDIVIGDHAWTPGRALADLVVDPDEMAFSVMSGLVDGVIAFKADPTNLGLAAFAAWRAKPILTATESGVESMKAAGMLNGIRKRINVQTARQWVLNEGTPIIKAFRRNAENVLKGEITLEEAVDLSRLAFPELPLSIHKELAGVAVNYARTAAANADNTLVTAAEATTAKAATSTVDELAPDSEYIDVLYKVLGRDIRNPLNTNRVVGGRFLLGSKSKMWATLPPTEIDPGDAEDALRGVDAAGKWIGAPDETVRKIRLQIIRSSGSPGEKEAIARAIMSMYEEAFVAAGMNRTWAKNMTQLVLDNIKDSAVYDINEAGLNTHMPFLKVDPVTQLPIADPTLFSEMRNSSFPLPNMRMSKRIVSGLGEFLNFEPLAEAVGGLPETTKAFNAMASSIEAMDAAMGVWKQLVLMRPAWGLRVVAEEQLRMAANGNASFFRSPLSALAWVLGSPMDANVEKRIKTIAATTGAVAGGIYGAQEDGVEGAIVGAAAGGAGGYALARTRAEDLAEGFNKAKAKYGRGTSGIRSDKEATKAPSFFDRNEFDDFNQSQYGGFRNMEPSQAAKVRTHIFDSVLRTDPKAAEAYAEELMRVGSDPVVRAVLNEPDIAKVKDDFWSGDLSKFREFLARAPDRPGAVRQWRELRNDRQLADEYIDYIAGRIERVTNGNSKFLEVLKTGAWGDEAIGFRLKNGGAISNSKVYKDQAWIDEVNKTAPNKFRIERTITRTDADKRANLARIRKTFDLFFDALMPRPSNYLSRSPMFRQSYWQRIEELFPEMGTTARARVIEDARQANLGKATIARLEAMDRYLVDVMATRRAEAAAKAVDVPGEATFTLRDGWDVRGVPTAEGLPELFHGTANRFGDEIPSIGYGNGLGNLMGPGFYATDDLATAAEYRKKGLYDTWGDMRPGTNPVVYSVEWIGPNAPRIIDAELPPPPALRSTLENWVTTELAQYDRSVEGWDELLATLRDPDATLGQMIDKIRWHIVDEVTGGDRSNFPEYDFLFREMQEQIGRHADVLRHQGGLRTNSKEHNAYVFLNEEAVKVHVVNRDLGWDTATSTPATTVTPKVKPINGTIKAKTADTLAKKFALDETKNLLYDLSEKSQFFDATRLIFPFGEAWKEIVTRWATLLAEHPNYIRRAQQTVQAARQMKVDEVTGLPDPGGIGMFHKDITTGEESFIYPMSGLLTNKLMGVPIPLVGSVQGLNLIGTGLPGIGPVVQFPTAWLLPNTPKYDTVRKLLFPYGEPEGGNGPANLVLETFMPAWSKKIVQAFKSPNADRLQGNVVGAMMQYKLSTGEYDVNGPDAQDEIARLIKDSTEAGKQYMIIRGLAQSMMPSAPAPQYLVKHGPNLVIAAKVADDYRKRAEKVGWDNAFEWLLERYGPDTALMLAQPRSEALIPGLTSKTEQLTWERSNPTLVNRYPDVWTMFAPRNGEFDIGGYTQEFERGQRASLTPREMIREANNRLARHVYNRQRDKFETDGKMTDQETAQLRKWREELIVDFPGYDPYAYQNRTPILVGQLKDAVKEPALARTRAGQAIVDYLNARARAEAEAAKRGVLLFGTSESGKSIRDQLFAFGDSLRLREPDFGTAWDEVFAYEFKDR